MLDRIITWVVSLHDDLSKVLISKGIVDFLSGNANASGLGSMVTEIETCTANMRGSLQIAKYECTARNTEYRSTLRGLSCCARSPASGLMTSNCSLLISLG